MGVDENNMDFIEDKEMNEILDSAISEMLGRIKRSLEEEIPAKPLPPMVPIPIREEEPQKLAKVLEDLGVQTDAVAMDGEKKMQYQINIQEHARPACSPLHINLSLPPHTCPSTPPSSSPAPVKSTAEPRKEPKSTENASVQTVKIGDVANSPKTQNDTQRETKPGVLPIHINVTMPHICQPTTDKPTPAASQPDTAAEQKKKPALKEISVQTDDMVADTKEDVAPETTPAASQPDTAAEQKKKPALKEIGVQTDDMGADTKEDVAPETTPAASQPDTAAEQQKKPALKEIGVQTDDMGADTKKDMHPPLTVQLIVEESPATAGSAETLEPQKEGKPVETVSVQTEETAADREKPVLYDINIQEHARPENTPLRINFNLPQHTCPKSAAEPPSDEESQESSDSQNEDEVTDGVGVQTIETGDDRPKPVQYKINIQEHKRPATSPLHITLNQPRHTCPASTVQSPPATPQPAKKPKIMKDLSVQTGENGAEKSSPNQYQFNIPKQSGLESSPIRIHVNVPPHDCQSPSTVKRPSVRDISDSSQPPKRPKQVGDMSVQTDNETSKSKITQADKHGHVYINVKVPPHTCTLQTANPNLDKSTQATRKQSKPATYKGEGMQTSMASTDDSKMIQTKNQYYVLPDGTPFYITLNTASVTNQQAATQPNSVGKSPAAQKQSKPATYNKDVGMQTSMTSTDDSKMIQTKNQHYVLPDGTPVYITLNTPSLTCQQATTQPNSVGKTPGTRKQSKPATYNKDEGMQTSMASTDDSKMIQTKNQHYVLPDGTPVYITLNTPSHTCQQATTQPNTIGKTSAAQKQSKPATFNKDVGMQTSMTSTDDSKMIQTKNQHYVLPDGTPVYITLNAPSLTCQQATTQPNTIGKSPASPAQSKRSRLKEDVGVQADEISDNSKMTQVNSQNYVLPDGSPLQFTFNRPPNTHPKATVQPTLNRKIPDVFVINQTRYRISEYNSLTDSNLTAYFSNRYLRRHLRKIGLINKRGEIIPESTYRANISRAEQQEQVKEALAQAIVHKSVDLQLKRENEINQKVEEISKLELVRKMRSERYTARSHTLLTSATSRESLSRRASSVAGSMRHQPWTNSRPRTAYEQQGTQNSDMSFSSLDLESKCSTISRDHSTLQTQNSSTERDQYFPFYLDVNNLRQYGLKLAPLHDTWKKQLKSPYLATHPSTGDRMKPIRPKTTPKLMSNHNVNKAERYNAEARMRTNCNVTMKFLGKHVTKLPGYSVRETEVVVQQQHCGGNTVCVYHGKLLPQENFTFISHRHINFPFSLSVYLDGILHLRVSVCCEYRHQRGGIIGGPQGQFILVSVKGSMPCARCKLNKDLRQKKQKKMSHGKTPESAFHQNDYRDSMLDEPDGGCLGKKQTKFQSKEMPSSQEEHEDEQKYDHHSRNTIPWEDDTASVTIDVADSDDEVQKEENQGQEAGYEDDFDNDADNEEEKEGEEEETDDYDNEEDECEEIEEEKNEDDPSVADNESIIDEVEKGSTSDSDAPLTLDTSFDDGESRTDFQKTDTENVDGTEVRETLLAKKADSNASDAINDDQLKNHVTQPSTNQGDKIVEEDILPLRGLATEITVTATSTTLLAAGTTTTTTSSTIFASATDMAKATSEDRKEVYKDPEEPKANKGAPTAVGIGEQAADEDGDGDDGVQGHESI